MTFNARYFSILILLLFILAASVSVYGQNVNTDVGLRTVVIDPGHGGKDPGAPGPDSRRSEKHIVLNISKKLGTMISQAYPDVKVVYTRSTDVFPKLTDRVKTAHSNNADLFISIHCNSNKNKASSGSSAHILSRKDTRNPNRDLFDENVELTKLENSVIQFEEDQSSYKEDSAEDQILNTLLFHANFDHSVLFAQLIVENLATKPFHKWGKGIHQNDFLLLKKMTCPAVLVEAAFLSNPDERQLLVDEKWQEEIAKRLFKAFKEYKAVYDGSISTSAEPVAVQEADIAPSSAPAAQFYGIQVMGLGRLLKNGDPALKGLEVSAIKAEESSIYKYVHGRFASAQEASARLQDVRKKFPEAFVVKVNGTSVTRHK
jgi:N-acetylmuramoyl-L-alanine amidase